MGDKKSSDKRASQGARSGGARYSQAPKAGASVPVQILAAGVVVALVVGVLVGHFVLGGGAPSPAFPGATTVSESDLDRVIASYTYNGKTETITVRDAIESQISLDSAKDSDGNYSLPNADSALAVARNQILAKQAEAEGITVSDDEIGSYAEQILGTSDIASLAQQYGLTEDQAKEVVRESAAMYKLKEKVCSTQAGTIPDAPTAPAEGAEDTATSDYGAYIVNLIGDEWDATNNTWARTDGPYYEALKDETWTPDSATYAQAQIAYAVAYRQYASNATASSSEWTAYVNGILSSASIQIYTLGA